jgi:hypothetical protein
MPCADCAGNKISTRLTIGIASPALWCCRIVAVCLRNYKEGHRCRRGAQVWDAQDSSAWAVSTIGLTHYNQSDHQQAHLESFLDPKKRRGTPQHNDDCVSLNIIINLQITFRYSDLLWTGLTTDRISSPNTVKNLHVRFEVFTAVTMKNAVYCDIKTQPITHNRHITSPLQSPVS